MKKLVFLAALVLAALTMRAQNPVGDNLEPTADSVSVMLQHLARTNAEVAYLNDNLRLHSQLALGSFALEGVGVACLLMASNATDANKSQSLKYLGIGFGAVGALGFLCSYIPIWTSKVRFDSRGLVVSLP